MKRKPGSIEGQSRQIQACNHAGHAGDEGGIGQHAIRHAGIGGDVAGPAEIFQQGGAY
jgi:hypothetical protein